MPLLKSWVAGANARDGDFPLNNLPCGVFSVAGDAPRCGVAIGDMILDCQSAEAAGLTGTAGVFEAPSWNAHMAAGPAAWRALRARLTALLAQEAPDAEAVRPHLVPREGAALHMPFTVAEYTDFYSGIHHAFNVGTMFRGPENALPANYLHLPIGYNGRASTVVVSGTDVVRPLGQSKAPDADAPTFGPSKRFDLELEMGAVVGTPSAMGRPVSVAEAAEMIFGYVLLNDWSARDIQAWEYQPLGPFQAKATATTISPWIVTSAALAPFKVPVQPRQKALLPYLEEAEPSVYNIDLAVEMAPAEGAAAVICNTNARELYFSSAQQLAHHTSSGCAMRTGDLLGTGTISGPNRENFGALLEITWNGRDPVELSEEVTRTFIEDGDTITLRGTAHGDGYRVGFGPCAGTVRPAVDFP